MEKIWDHKKNEKSIYKLWENAGVFKESPGKKPYTILMPPPNANASLHAGHAMYTVDDILIRFKRMRGFSALWIPGVDHAGFETQYVYEKELSKKGKSRLDFDRNSLYENIFKFVKGNSGLIFEQFKRLGFSADWERSVFTLDKKVIKRVFKTFKKMEKEGLVYRDDYIVNYCTHCGTSLADLEVSHIERVDPLYFIKYGPFTLATVRPETKFGDTAVAVHPKDKRYLQWVGKEIEAEGLNGKFKIKVIADESVDPNFGTGVVKITPAHDPNDFETGKRHNLEVKRVIDLNGRLNNLAGKYAGLKVMEARKKVAEDLQKRGLMEKIDNKYLHSVAVCYKCKHDLEPTIIPNWFIKVKGLKEKVRDAVEKDQVKFFPKKYKKHMLSWLDIMHDWPISRQIVWGIRIPAWYNLTENPNLNISFLNKNGEIKTGLSKQLLENYPLHEIEKGLQSVIAPRGAKYKIAEKKPGNGYLQETDTFDTWFSSGQWPLVTIKTSEYDRYLPTDVLGTLSDILKFWVSRMIMFTLYLEHKIPFKDVYLWSMVADEKGVKMSKSKGNVIDPIELVDKYGADALRFSLLYGVPAGSKAILSDNKVRGMRNFSNKIWNIGRFVLQNRPPTKNSKLKIQNEDDKWILEELEKTTKKVTDSLENYKLNEAAEEIYDFIWHRFADVYIEKIKDWKDKKATVRKDAVPVLYHVLKVSIKLLHPFMPFVTEAIFQKCFAKKRGDLLAKSSWPNLFGGHSDSSTCK
jgi:valyl-tRNA synthetase